MTTSVMFCTYNRLNFTQRMLGSFFKNTTSPYHLIIVDNGSTDGTTDWLLNLMHNHGSPHCQEIVVHFNEQNRGIAAGRNKGLQIADRFKDEYLSTLDNDIELPPNWLEDCTNIIKANPYFAIGINMEGTTYPILNQNGVSFQLKARGNLGTACTVFRRDLHDKIGFFCTEYGSYGEEDADFFFRARLVNYQMGYLKEMGTHFGEGAVEDPVYRQFKTQCHANNLAKFQHNCGLYVSRQKPILLPFSE
jgi:glycosyltransferase involved in cell wall biosynthesis